MQTIHINLNLNEIVYDIQNKTYLTGRSRHDGSNHEQVANMQANDDEECANQILRSIDTAFNNLKTKLSEYLVSLQVSGSNDLPGADDSLELTLQMPSNYNNATVDTIASASHQYIVSSAVAEWFAITCLSALCKLLCRFVRLRCVIFRGTSDDYSHQQTYDNSE